MVVEIGILQWVVANHCEAKVCKEQMYLSN
uniref:Uncharacterized protein n=1 Tax=Arundo donax TaxID=35708 RepID=A0A0A8ZTN4_ARUDO